MNAPCNSLSLIVGGNSIPVSGVSSLLPPISAKKVKAIKQICTIKGGPSESKSIIVATGPHRDPPREISQHITPSMPSTPSMKRKPIGMTRAQSWSLEVENAFRFQEAGFADFSEYAEAGYESPEIWPSGFVKCLKAKKTGFFLYFRAHRECLDKHLNKVKIYTY
jgi:hypothetical protein